MRFSLSAITLVGAAVLSSAAVLPRAGLKPTGIEARYYDVDVFKRTVPNAPIAIEHREPQLRTRRLHSREFHVPVEARHSESDVYERDDIYERIDSAPRVVERRAPAPGTRRFHAREFRRRLPVARSEHEDDIYERAVPVGIVVVARREPLLRSRRIHSREFRIPIAAYIE